tara:strand:- start:477 stop:917 length:441 start_codon:yes stop_codon:yes gene_type:complete
MKILFYFAFLILASNAHSKNCEMAVAASDAMAYDTKEINVDGSCKTFKINFTHTGKLAKEIMGHNLVFVETANLDTTIKAIDMSAGVDNGYLPKMKEIIYKSKMLGGGDKDSFTLDMKNFKKGGDYTFFCSVPGHYIVMKGKLVFQ